MNLYNEAVNWIINNVDPDVTYHIALILGVITMLLAIATIYLNVTEFIRLCNEEKEEN